MPFLLIILTYYMNIFANSYSIPNFQLKDPMPLPTIVNGYDPCRYFKIKNDSIYKIGISNIISKWNTYDTSNYYEQTNYYSPSGSDNITNIGLSMSSDDMALSLFNTTKFDILNSSDLSIKTSYPEMNTSQVLYSLMITKDLLYMFKGNRVDKINHMTIYHRNMTFINYWTSNIYFKLNATLSNDENFIIDWTNTSWVNIFKKNTAGGIGSIVYKLTNYDPSKSRNSTLNNVQISLDGHYAVLQFDDKWPLTVIDLTTMTVVITKNFSTVINQVLFLDKGTLLGVCLNYSRMQVYDALTMTLQKTVMFTKLSNYSAIHYQSQSIYQCLDQQISVTQLSCPPFTYYDPLTFTCINCILEKNCISCDASTGLCSQCIRNSLLKNGTCGYVQLTFMDGVSNLISNNTGVISTFIIGLQISPFAMNCIQFITFWNICCIYALIDLQHSQSLWSFFNGIYNAVQTSIFQYLNIKIPLPQLTNVNINNYFPSYYSLEYDALKGNFQNFLLVIFQLVFLLVVSAIRQTCTSKTSLMRKILYFDKTESLLGQIISFVPFTILPFKYFIKVSANSNFMQKLNNGLLIVLVFVCIMLPFIIALFYFNKQPDDRDHQKLPKHNRRVAKIDLKPDIIKSKILTMKFLKDEPIKNKQSNSTIEDKYKIVNAFINLTVPILIIFSVTQPFFIINTLIYSYRIYLSTKLEQYRVSCIISSSFFLLFHLSFYLCYLSLSWKSEQIFSYVAVFCFLALFLGGVYQFLRFVISIFIQLFIWYRNNLKVCQLFKNKVQVQVDNRNCNEGQNINQQSVQIKSVKIQNKNFIKTSKDRNNKTFKRFKLNIAKQDKSVQNEVQQKVIKIKQLFKKSQKTQKFPKTKTLMRVNYRNNTKQEEKDAIQSIEAIKTTINIQK